MAVPDPIGRPSILRRLASMFYEALLLLGVLAVLLVLPHVLLGAFGHRLADPVIVRTHFFIVLLVYFLWFWSNGGQTLAMKTWRIRLVTRDGLPVRPVQALVRFLLCWPSLALLGAGFLRAGILWALLDLLWALVDRDRLFLRDRLASTQLVMT